MGATGVTEEIKEKTRAGGSGPAFASREELCEVLERLLEEVDADPEIGPKMRSARVPHRFVFTDVEVVLDITASELDDRALRWEFSERADWKPVLTMEMESEVANRYLQGRENLPIALARGRIRLSCAEARAALSLLPTNRELIKRYSEIIARDYPHLALD